MSPLHGHANFLTIFGDKHQTECQIFGMSAGCPICRQARSCAGPHELIGSAAVSRRRAECKSFKFAHSVPDASRIVAQHKCSAPSLDLPLPCQSRADKCSNDRLCWDNESATDRTSLRVRADPPYMSVIHREMVRETIVDSSTFARFYRDFHFSDWRYAIRSASCLGVKLATIPSGMADGSWRRRASMSDCLSAC